MMNRWWRFTLVTDTADCSTTSTFSGHDLTTKYQLRGHIYFNPQESQFSMSFLKEER